MVEQAETALEFGSGQVTALERLEREHNNLRTAIQLAAECETVDLELRLVGSLAYFWIMRGYFTEALERLRNALQRGRSAPAGHRAKALAYAGYLAFQQGDSAAAERLLEEAETLANSAGDHSLQALVLVNRAFIARAQGRKSEDLQLIEAAIRSGESANIPPPSILRYQHANALLRLGDINRASMLHEENLRDARAVGDAYSAAAVLLDLGFIALARGNQKRAAACWREALGLVEQLGELLIGEFCLEALALISGLQGRLEQAAVLLGAAERMCQRIGAPAPGAPGTEHRVSLPGAPSIAEIIDNARRALGEPAFTTAWRMGSDASIQYLIDQTCEL
jgi:tetratricopeptide (TPR) repeat protein